MQLLDVTLDRAEDHLALDEALLEHREEVLRFWESGRPVVVAGRGARIHEEVRLDVCRRDGVEALRRCSGGGTVVLAVGCLNYTLVFPLADHPEWHSVRRSLRDILGRMAKALGAQVHDPADLAWRGRKVSGNAQRRTAHAILHHGTLLYAFDPALAARYLAEPRRQPPYRGGRAHADFLGNLPLSAAEIRRRVAEAWQACPACARACPTSVTGLLLTLLEPAG